MTTYFMFGKYTHEGIKAVSAERTKQATALIEQNGGKVISGYALLGEYDLILILDFQDTSQAMKTSVGLTKMLGIAFTTAPAVSVEEFDQMMT